MAAIPPAIMSIFKLRETTMAIQKQMDAGEWAMLVALSLLWGGSFFFIGVAVKELPPVTIVTLRVSLAACR